MLCIICDSNRTKKPINMEYNYIIALSWIRGQGNVETNFADKNNMTQLGLAWLLTILWHFGKTIHK